jgi:glycosyltransferase involved in cell wall biosynthesis
MPVDTSLRRAVIVLGMHRSGTSAVTRALSFLGTTLPQTLLPADKYNEPGYWESERIKTLNDEILATAESAWDDVAPFPDSWHLSESAQVLRSKLVDALHREYGTAPHFILKDSRISRFVPFWLSVLDEFGAEPSFVISVRHPLEVAASLAFRDGFSTEQSLFLWLRHNLEAEFHTRAFRRAFVFYDTLLNEPYQTISELVEDLEIEWPLDASAHRLQIEESCPQRLRHHIVSTHEYSSRHGFSKWAGLAYSSLREVAGPEELRITLDKIRADLSAADETFGPLFTSLQTKERKLSSEVARLSAVSSSDALDALENFNDDGHPRLALEAKQSEFEKLYLELASRISQLEGRVETTGPLIADRTQLESFSKEVIDRDRRIRSLTNDLRDLTALLDEKAENERQLTDEIERRDTAIAESEREFNDVNTQLTERNVELSYVLGQLGLLTSEHLGRMANPSTRRNAISRLILSAPIFGATGVDPKYYLARYPDVAASPLDPFLHYVLFGRKEGRRRCADQPSFSRYEEMRVVLESGQFDETYYCSQNSDVVLTGLDPIEHFLCTGGWEGRNPNPNFHSHHYLTTYPDVVDTKLNPLAHYLLVGRQGGRSTSPPSQENSSAHRIRVDASEDGKLHEDAIEIETGRQDLKMIAFYLPQFHPFPENERFWGKGFTEWTKTTQARPQFEGHHQPRQPGELGFYDLRVKETQLRQIELAKQFGIAGFCYHHYWFNGRPVMHRPLDQILDDPDLDLPFCLHWANEPWTPRWDGCHEGGILLDQEHSPDDDIAFIRGIERALRDERYIRVNGRPLLGIYRSGLFPDMQATIERWREYCMKVGIGDLYLTVTQQPFDGTVDPREYGFDAAVEFPPHNYPTEDVGNQVQLSDADFPGSICSYPAVVRASLEKRAPEYKLFRGIMPGFDNTARRRNSGIYIGNSPDLYESWLDGLCRYTKQALPPGEQLIFVNAWNEWAEGAYLEPDQKHGYAFLNRTAKSLRRAATGTRLRKIVVLGHDAAQAGSQILLLDLLKWVVRRTSTEVKLILGTGGALLESYQAVVDDVMVLSELARNEAATDNQKQAIAKFIGEAPDLIYANTVAAGEYLTLLDLVAAPIVMHIYELEQSIQRFARAEAVERSLNASQMVIAASPPVAANLLDNHSLPAAKVATVFSFITPESSTNPPSARQKMREFLNIGLDDVAVFGCGTRDWRKAPDLFVDVAARLLEDGHSKFCFFWLGGPIDGQYGDLESSLKGRGLASFVRFLGPVQSPREYFRAGDLFLLPSREDPFPLVCLEAAECRLPTVCFDGAGGMPAFVEDDAGIVVAYEDVAAMTAAVSRLLRSSTLRKELGSAARGKLLKRHTTDAAMPEIFDIVRRVSNTPPKISVIIPSYNYAHYLEKRLSSICTQTFQDFEIIIEDDCSTDNTLEVLSRFKTSHPVKVVTHEENSGVFSMWREGLEKASGSIIWIAEENDLCEPTFLERLIPNFDDTRINLAYCQSSVIDENGSVGGDYSLRFPELSESKWSTAYTQDADRELRDGLAIKNFILNASGVLFRRPNISSVGAELAEFRLAGDWFLYLSVLQGGRVAYLPDCLNYHRRHSQSVIGRAADSNLLIAELGKVHRFIRDSYSIGRETSERMTAYAQELWRERNPFEPVENFWSVYGSEVSNTATSREMSNSGA